jgi:hypothetical protein
MNQNDPNIGRRGHPMTKDENYTGWIIGGLVALAIVMGLFWMVGRKDHTNTAANNVNASDAATATAGVVSEPVTNAR